MKDKIIDLSLLQKIYNLYIKFIDFGCDVCVMWFTVKGQSIWKGQSS